MKSDEQAAKNMSAAAHERTCVVPSGHTRLTPASYTAGVSALQTTWSHTAISGVRTCGCRRHHLQTIGCDALSNATGEARWVRSVNHLGTCQMSGLKAANISTVDPCPWRDPCRHHHPATPHHALTTPCTIAITAVQRQGNC